MGALQTPAAICVRAHSLLRLNVVDASSDSLRASALEFTKLMDLSPFPINRGTYKGHWVNRDGRLWSVPAQRLPRQFLSRPPRKEFTERTITHTIVRKGRFGARFSSGRLPFLGRVIRRVCGRACDQPRLEFKDGAKGCPFRRWSGRISKRGVASTLTPDENWPDRIDF